MQYSLEDTYAYIQIEIGPYSSEAESSNVIKRLFRTNFFKHNVVRRIVNEHPVLRIEILREVPIAHH